MFNTGNPCANGSLIGLPPSALKKLNIEDLNSHLSRRGRTDLDGIHEIEQYNKRNREWDTFKTEMEKILKIPVIRTIRILLPQQLKDKIKTDVKQTFFNENSSDEYLNP